MPRKKYSDKLSRVVNGLEICTPGCATSKSPHSVNCKCWCEGAGHGMLYQAGLTAIDRARLKADMLSMLQAEVIKVKTRFRVSRLLLENRQKEGRRTSVRDYPVRKVRKQAS